MSFIFKCSSCTKQRGSRVKHAAFQYMEGISVEDTKKARYPLRKRNVNSQLLDTLTLPSRAPHFCNAWTERSSFFVSMPPCATPKRFQGSNTSCTGKCRAKAAFKRDFWWPCHTSIPNARWPLSPRSDTWMIGAGRLYRGLLRDREAERIGCREHILHTAIYCSHKAHRNLHAINHRISEAERERETVSTLPRQGSTGWGQLSTPEIQQLPSPALGESPQAGKVITKQHSKSQEQHAYTLQ